MVTEALFIKYTEKASPVSCLFDDASQEGAAYIGVNCHRYLVALLNHGKNKGWFPGSAIYAIAYSIHRSPYSPTEDIHLKLQIMGCPLTLLGFQVEFTASVFFVDRGFRVDSRNWPRKNQSDSGIRRFGLIVDTQGASGYWKLYLCFKFLLGWLGFKLDLPSPPAWTILASLALSLNLLVSTGGLSSSLSFLAKLGMEVMVAARHRVISVARTLGFFINVNLCW